MNHNVEHLDIAIKTLVGEFVDSPYASFTKADAVTRFQTLLGEAPEYSRTYPTADGHQVSLVHREYPTFFRLHELEPQVKLLLPRSRGHYDMVIIEPDVVSSNSAEVIVNSDIARPVQGRSPKLFACLEFKLDPIGWSDGRTRRTIGEFSKLDLTEEDARHRYLISLMRYTATTDARWKKYWHLVQSAAVRHPDIKSIFAVSWMGRQHTFDLFPFGPWPAGLWTRDTDPGWSDQLPRVVG